MSSDGIVADSVPRHCGTLAGRRDDTLTTDEQAVSHSSPCTVALTERAVPGAAVAGRRHLSPGLARTLRSRCSWR
jgi:hypothetical protein